MTNLSDRIDRYGAGVMESCWLTALVIAPLYFNSFSSRVFEPDKIALIRTLAMVTAWAWAVRLCARMPDRKAVEEHLREFFRNPGTFPVIAAATLMAIASIVSAALSISPRISFWGSYHRQQGVFTFLSCLVLCAAPAVCLRTRAQLDRLLCLVAATSFAVSLYGLLQHFHLDPLPWSDNTSLRIKGNMGNEIFLGAYLIVTSVILLGQVVRYSHDLLQAGNRATFETARVTLYMFLFIVNLVGLWFTASRGPQLALLCGLFFFLLMASVCYRIRALACGTLAAALLAAVLIAALNMPMGLVAGLKQIPGLQRISQLGEEFASARGTAGVRLWIWEGIARCIAPHAPLENPETGPDRVNVLRPLIGYGPETLSMVFHRFYPPQLGQLERIDAIPDRAHSEFLENLVGTGLLGGVAYLMLWLAIPFVCLRWMGLIPSAWHRRRFLAYTLGGAALGAAIGFAWRGAQLLGIGLILGMLSGLAIYLAQRLLIRIPAVEGPVSPAPFWKSISLIGLLAALLAHFAESNVGITVAATQVHLWILLGVILALIRGFDEAVKEVPHTAIFHAARATALISPVLLSLAFLFCMLGFGIPLARFFTTLDWRNVSSVPPGMSGLVVLVVLTWIVGCLLAWLGTRPDQATPADRCVFLLALVMAAVPAVVASILFTGHVSRSLMKSSDPPELLARTAAQLSDIFPLFVAVILAAVAAQAWFFVADREKTISPRAYSWPSVTVITGVLFFLAVSGWLAARAYNVRPIQADMLYRAAIQTEAIGQLPAAKLLLERCVALQPEQDYYCLPLARVLLQEALKQTDRRQGEVLKTSSESRLLEARRLNPYNPDFTAALARLYLQWSAHASGAEERRALALKSDLFYIQAMQLSPGNVALICEQGGLRLQSLGNAGAAFQLAQQAIELNPEYQPAYLLLSDAFAQLARSSNAAVFSARLRGMANAARRRAAELQAR